MEILEQLLLMLIKNNKKSRHLRMDCRQESLEVRLRRESFLVIEVSHSPYIYFVDKKMRNV